jgi:SulP family sulfate permease
MVKTIGTSFEIPMGLPKLFKFENFEWSMIRDLLPNAFTIAILAAIESLLSCVVSDGMIGSRTRTNMELIAQGIGNIGSALFGGIPATGAIARTSANVKNGGRSPVAGIVHAIVLALMLLVLMPLVKLIPMPCIAAILFMVAYGMSGWRAVASTTKHAPKSDVAVMATAFILTVVLDLVYAIVVGLVLASLLFMKRMSEVTNVEGWEYIDDYNKVKSEEDNYDEETDPDNIKYKAVPKNTLVFEITGPLFFGAADKLSNIVNDTDEDIIILRMRSVPAMDATVMHTLDGIYDICKKNAITLIFSHVNEQPMSVMEKAGFVDRVGKDNFCHNIDDALELAEQIENTK